MDEFPLRFTFSRLEKHKRRTLYCEMVGDAERLNSVLLSRDHPLMLPMEDGNYVVGHATLEKISDSQIDMVAHFRGGKTFGMVVHQQILEVDLNPGNHVTIVSLRDTLHYMKSLRALKVAEGRATEAGVAKTQTVYRMYGRKSELLYVGITNRGMKRLLEHQQEKFWFNEVTRVEFEQFALRRSAEQREKDLISKLAPLYNVVHNHGRQVLAARLSDPDDTVTS